MTTANEPVVTSRANRRRRLRDLRLPESAETALLLVALIVAWEVLARTVFAGSFALAAPTDIAAHLWQEWHRYLPSIRATLWTAAQGFFIGNAIAILAAALIVQLPLVERPVFSLALAIYCVPIIALAPILQVLFERDQAMVVLSALAVIFTTLVATVLGLRSADPATLEVIHVLGGGSRHKLTKVRLRSALPSLFAGLRVAAPAAILGAAVGEFMGAERGLGVLIVSALSSMETTRVWTVALLATALSGGVYLLVGWLGRRLTPWVRGMTITHANVASRPGSTGAGARTRRTIKVILHVALDVVVVVGAWAIFIQLSGLDVFFAKGPADVWELLFTASDAAANRELIFGGLLITLRNASLGFVAGMVLATLAAIIFVLRPTVERAVMPVAVTLRSIPILATTPLVILILGRSLVATTVIVAIMSFFPTLVNMMVGMRSTRQSIVEVIQVYGGSRLTILWRAELPSALPALMASARIAVPSSILGAVVIEWLVTGEGLGNAILAGVYNADYGVLWAVAAVLAAVSMSAYGIIVIGERAVLRRYAPEQLQ